MRARIDLEHPRGPSAPEATALALAAPNLVPVGAHVDLDADLANALPADHPAWVRDAVSISQRARQLFADLRPVVIRVLTVWDHLTRSIVIGGRRLEVDASGSYRMP